MRLLRAGSGAFLPFLVLVFCGFVRESAIRLDVPAIVTAAPAYRALAALRGEDRFPRGAQLLLLKDGESAPLVDGFAASADANVSFDATTVLFAGKKNPGDHWAVWELSLANHAVRKVIGGDTDCVRPMYLPGGRLVFARRTEQGFQLEAADLDGSNALPLSHLPASTLPDDVLADGRILFEAGFPLGIAPLPEMFLVYSDGSGVESYRCDHGAARWGGRQLASGDVVFTHGQSLARFTSPLATEAHISAPPADYAGNIAETPSGDWLVSARPSAKSNYALRLWKPGTSLLQTVYSRSGVDLVEPVLLAPRTRPKRHPSGLHNWDYANLLVLDARVSRDGALKSSPASVRFETLDESGKAAALGTAPVEPDGSFFVTVPGNRPIRMALVDGKGVVIRQERGWFWCAGGEQRICVGCHAGPERAPENRVPAVLLRSTTPRDLTGAAHSAAVGSR